VTVWKPRCATPEGIRTVDAAFARPGSSAQRRMENEICPGCDHAAACLKFALDNGEHGLWGGTSERRRRKIVRRPYTFNLGSTDAPLLPKEGSGRKPSQAANVTLLRRHGFDAAAVKRWALATGRVRKVPRGAPSVALIQAYADEHTTTGRPHP
jgi:hypothetical protein